MCHCTVIQPIWTDFPAAGAKEEEEDRGGGRAWSKHRRLLPRQILSGEGREVLNGENGGRREMTQTKKIWEMIRYIVLYALSAIKKRNI